MKKCLVLRLAGPMQSWGTQSRFTERDTGREPSRSGVIGLLSAARGIDRSDTEWLRKLSALKMGIRVEREGVLSRDYHTAGGGTLDGEDYGVFIADGSKRRTVVSNRYFLADAEFYVVLESEDSAQLEGLHAALCSPHWPLYLGRKSFPPTPPLYLGIQNGTLEEVLKKIRWRMRSQWDKPPQRLRAVIECGPGEGTTRTDVPLSFENGKRSFTLRYVCPYYIEDFEVDEFKEDGNVSITPLT